MALSKTGHPRLKIYDQLLKFQLFQGLSRTELMQMAGQTKFGFMKQPAGTVVSKEGMPCQQLTLLTDGSLLLTTRSDDGGYAMVEQVNAPWPLQPEALFGVQPRYSSDSSTLTPCSFITLSKDEVMRLLDEFLIVRLNLLNMLATRAQRSLRQQWRREPRSLRERFVRFVLDHALYPAGAKELQIKMTRLAAELGDSRLDTSKMLNRLQDEHLLVLHRGRIEIPSLEQLLMK